MQTYTGVQFYHLDPCPADVQIADIAHALANQCRFAGHTRTFYSVAQHAVLVSLICPAPLAMLGLLHDAAEAYLVDVPTPLKPHLPDYHTWEAELLAAITWRFCGQAYRTLPDEIKLADRIMLATEARDLLGPAPAPWTKVLPAPLGERILAWSPADAECRFLWRFHALRAEVEAE
jgi:hypothetical protein